MKKRDLVRSTVAVTAMMIMASVSYTANGSPLGNIGVVQEVQAAEIDTENPNQEDFNDIASDVVSDSTIDADLELSSDIKFTIPGQLFVYQGDVLTEEVLKLPSGIHLVDAPYVCEQVGSFSIYSIVINDNNEYGSLDYNVVVYERPATPAPTLTTTPSPTPTTTPTPTTAPTPTPTITPVAPPSSTPALDYSQDGVVTSSPVYSENDEEGGASQTVSKVSKTVEIACGKTLTLESMGFQTIFLQVEGEDSYSYVYDDCVVGGKYSYVDSFKTEVVQINDRTGERTIYEVTVKVVDKTAPTLKGIKSTIKIVGGKDVVARIKKGVSAKDNVDGKIAKSKIKISGYKAKKYGKVQKVTFTVKDKAGNIKKKTVKLKITNPVKKLNKTMYVKTSTLNVRSSSSAKGKKLGTLKFGTKVKVIGQDRNTGWYKIKYKGKTAWVNKSYVSSKKPSKPVSKKKTSNSSPNKVAYNCYDDPVLECIPEDSANWDCFTFCKSYE